MEEPEKNSRLLKMLIKSISLPNKELDKIGIPDIKQKNIIEMREMTGEMTGDKTEDNFKNTATTANLLKTTQYDNYTMNTFNKTGFNQGIAYTIKSKYLLLVSIFFVSLSLLFIKVLFHSYCEAENSNNTLNFFCGFYMFLFSMIFLKVDNIDLSNKNNFNKGEIDYLLIRSFLGFLSIYFTVKALNNMRLVSATTLIYLSPIICTFILLIRTREKLKRSDKVCLIVSILIIFLFIIQDFQFEESVQFSDSFRGVLYSVLAAFLSSINSVIDQKICYEFHSYTILFMTGIFSIILTPIFMSFSNDKFYMNTRIFILFFLLGASCFFGFYFSHKTIEANSLLINSALHSITIALSYLYSFVIFDEPVTLYDIIASCLIILINFLMKLRAEECENCDNAENL